MFRTIWSKTLRDYRVAIMGWGTGLGVLMLIMFAAATPPVIEAYAEIAASFRFLGDAFAINTPEGYVTMRLMQVGIPILLSIWPILAGARMVRREEDRGTMDVLLSTPVARTRLMLEKLLALVIALLIIAVVIALGAIAGEPAAHVEVNPARALLATLNVSLLAFLFATVALLISQFTRSTGAAAGWASVIMIVSFIFDGIGRTVSGSWVQYLSPFYYYNLNRPLIASFDDSPAAALLLIGVGLFLVVASVIIFVRRDIGRVAVAVWGNHAEGNHQLERSLRRAERDVWIRSIILRALSAQGWTSFWWLLGIIVWCGLLVALIPSFQEPMAKALAQSPDLAALFSGADMGTNAGFLSGLVYAFVPALVVIFALTLALNWAGDLEEGRLELVLGTPLTRTRLMLERFGAIVLAILPVPVLAWLAVTGAAQKAHLSIDQGSVLAASFSVLPPALVVAALVYALAGRLRYGMVYGLLALYIALAFLADFLRDLLHVPDALLSLSIFHLYGTPVIDGMNWASFLGMIVATVVLLLAGLVQFRAADIERG